MQVHEGEALLPNQNPPFFSGTFLCFMGKYTCQVLTQDALIIEYGPLMVRCIQLATQEQHLLI
jgi:hypothetical protein